MPPMLPDEDYINKSLLASLDAQADAEPIPSSDDSSSGSPSHRLRAQEAYYTQYRQQDYSSDEYDYRNSFNSYPNTTRSRQNTFYQDLYPQQHITSPPQSHAQPYDSRTSYDLTNGVNGAHNKFHLDQYSSSLLQGKLGQQPQAQTYSNGVQITSQTPYGPHLPTNVPSAPPVAPPGSLASNGVNGNSNAAGEEISTIFVVGFPEDMQEREFQNMFTFSPGFEAATLKIPNKEYTSYGGLVGGPSGASTLPNGLRGAAGFAAFPGGSQNDPYNLVTVNVDSGRDAWSSAGGVSTDDLAAATSNPHFLSSINGLAVAAASGANSSNIPPRKQIIGFAKFRSREEALNARDVLQGRRVDIEKGAVLKAEMAKKNLHTKRGVGPVQGVVTGNSSTNMAIPGVTGPNGLQQQQQQVQALQHQSHLQSQAHLGNALDTFGSVSEFRDSAALSGLGRLGWRDSMSSIPSSSSQQQSNSVSVPTELSLSHNGSTTSLVNGLPGTPSLATAVPSGLNGRSEQQEEEVRKRDSLVNALNMGSMSLNGTPTTPTLRGRDRSSIIGGVIGLDEERRKELREMKDNDSKEREITHNLMRLRERNSAAFDAFHSIGTPATGTMPIAIGMSRQTSVTSNGAGMTPSSTSSIASALTSSSVATASTAPTSLPAEGSPMISSAEPSDEVTQSNDFGSAGNQDEIVGPLDRLNLALPLAPGAGRARSETGRSASPPPQALESTHAMTNGAMLNGHVGMEHLHHLQVNDTAQPPPSSAPVPVPGAQAQPRSLHTLGSISSSISTTSTISSSSGSAGSTGNTSPTLPSPASGVSVGSGIMSVGSGSGSSNAGSVSTTGAVVRGTVDQNPPINTLYVGNLPTSPPPSGYPTDVLEDTLREIFQQRPGYRKLCFRQKAAGPMCFVEFEDVAFAARAMAEMTGHTLRGLVKNGIRLSYSKNPLGVRTPTSASSGGPTLQQQQQLMQTLSNHHHAQFQQQRHDQSHDGFQTRLPDEFLGSVLHQQQQQAHHQLQRGGMPPLLRRDSALSSNQQGPPPPPQGGPHHFVHQFQQQQQHHHTSSFGMGVSMGGNNLTNGNPNNTFLSSPPPRFFSTSPGGMSFASAAASTPLTGASNAFIPRSTTNGVIGGAGPMGAAYGPMLGGGHHSMAHHGGFNSPPTSFSPFGAFAASQGDASAQFGQLQQHSIPDGPQQQTHDD